MNENKVYEIHPNSNTFRISTMPIVHDETYDTEIFFDFDPFSTDPIGMFAYYIADNEIFISPKTAECMCEIVQNCFEVIGKEKYFDTIVICPENLGITKPVQLKNFYMEVFKNGYAMCPLYLPLFMCLGDNVLFPEETIKFATKPLLGKYLMRLDFFEKEDAFYMNPVELSLNSVISPSDDFVFIRPDKKQKRKFVASKFYKKEFSGVRIPNPAR